MHKFNVTLVALLVGIAAVLGAVAVTRTTSLGSAARAANDAAVSGRTKQLSAFSAKLQKELRAKPPALPKVPPRPAPPAAAPVSSAPRVVYHQPPPVVVTVHRHHGDDDSNEGGGGDD
jgi:hypothetical protein